MVGGRNEDERKAAPARAGCACTSRTGEGGAGCETQEAGTTDEGRGRRGAEEPGESRGGPGHWRVPDPRPYGYPANPGLRGRFPCRSAVRVGHEVIGRD